MATPVGKHSQNFPFLIKTFDGWEVDASMKDHLLSSIMVSPKKIRKQNSVMVSVPTDPLRPSIQEMYSQPMLVSEFDYLPQLGR